MSMAKEPGLAAGDRLLAVTTLSFDISVLETMLPLVVGATVIVAPRAATTDGGAPEGVVDELLDEEGAWLGATLWGHHRYPALRVRLRKVPVGGAAPKMVDRRVRQRLGQSVEG